MKEPHELWNDYARRRLADAGLKFDYWAPYEARKGIFHSCGVLPNITVILARTYTPEAFNRMLDGACRWNPVKAFEAGDITERMKFACEEGTIDLYIAPPNKISVVDITGHFPKSLSPIVPNVKYTFEPFLERLVRYVEKRLKK